MDSPNLPPDNLDFSHVTTLPVGDSPPKRRRGKLERYGRSRRLRSHVPTLPTRRGQAERMGAEQRSSPSDIADARDRADCLRFAEWGSPAMPVLLYIVRVARDVGGHFPSGAVLYVGQTCVPTGRFFEHRKRFARLGFSVRIEVRPVAQRDVFDIERALIRVMRPPLNRQYRDETPTDADRALFARLISS